MKQSRFNDKLFAINIIIWALINIQISILSLNFVDSNLNSTNDEKNDLPACSILILLQFYQRSI